MAETTRKCDAPRHKHDGIQDWHEWRHAANYIFFYCIFCGVQENAGTLNKLYGRDR